MLNHGPDNGPETIATFVPVIFRPYLTARGWLTNHARGAAYGTTRIYATTAGPLFRTSTRLGVGNEHDENFCGIFSNKSRFP